jgi:hypothetical protein
MEKKELQVEGATVPFFEYKGEEGRVIEFDTSECGPPEPMVNAMTALKFIDKDTKVIMINHKTPMGLLDKIGESYDIEKEDIDGGKVRLTFTYREGASEKANLDDSTCDGH